MNMLKKWLVDNGYTVADDATPEQIEAIAVKAISENKLSLRKYAELAAQKAVADETPADPAAARKQLVQEITTGVSEAVTKSNTALAEAMTTGFGTLAEALGVKNAGGDGGSVTDGGAGDGGAEDDADDLQLASDEQIAALEKRMEDRLAQKYNLGGRLASRETIDNVLKMADLSDEKSADSIRVKKTVERFTHKRTAALYRDDLRKGQPITYNGRALDEASELDKACCHAWFKYQVAPEALSQHDADLCCHVIETEKFFCTDSTVPVALSKDQQELLKHAVRHRIKAPLITDPTSGGVHAVPELFDNQAVTIPLLQQRLSPLVDMRDVPRGRQLEQFVLNNPSVGALTEGTPGAVFDATALIEDQVIPFFTVGGLFEVGKNFLEDAVPSMWTDIQQAYLRTYGKWLDDNIAGGDGTTEMLGILNASGVTDVPAATPTTGPLELADLMNLIAAVGAEYIEQFSRELVRFVMNQTVYYRFRALATGLTGDNRLLFGEKVDDYMLLSHKVALNGLGNPVILFGQLGGYQLVRRQAVMFSSTDQGESLFTKNTILIRSDARFGGRPKLGAYFAKIDDAQS